MDLVTREDLKALLAEHPSPCISLFMPTHRGGAEEDPIRWRKSWAEAEERLVHGGWRAAEVKELLAPGRRLLEDITFWKNQSDGLAAFLAPHFLRVFRLPLALKDGVVVANRFSVVPLLPLLSGNGRFFVLALSQNAVRLLEGTRYSVSEVDLKGVPRNLAEALITHDRDEPLTFHVRPTSGGGWGVIFEGHGVGIDDKKEDLLRYFQRIDQGLHPLLRQEKSPLVLAAVDYLQPIYRQANTYPELLEQGIEGNPDRLSNQELHDRSWPLVKPLFEKAQESAASQYRQLARTGHTSSNLEKVVVAAYEGRVETLFVALGRQAWGVVNPSAAHVELHEQPSFGDVDLLDFAAAQTLAHGGTVYAVEPEQVPSNTNVAATFCLPLPKHGKRP
jgi:hypothetical protein